MRQLTLAAVVLASLGAAATAEAQSGYREHDGFYLHADLGVGGMESGTSGAGLDDWKVTSAPITFAFAVGGSVARNLILGGQLWGAVGGTDTVKVGGRDYAGANAASIAVVAMGPNLTWYLPRNFYVSATPSVAVLGVGDGGSSHGHHSWDNDLFDSTRGGSRLVRAPRSSQAILADGTTDGSGAGLALRLAVGKEWWVGGSWGLGVNLHYAYASAHDSGASSVTWTTNELGVAFSATLD